jgi:hypothetical protein
MEGMEDFGFELFDWIGGIVEFVADVASDLTFGGAQDRRREEEVD